MNEIQTKKPLFKRATLGVLAAIAAGAIALFGTLFPHAKPVTDVAAPAVQEAIENAPARDEVPAPDADQPTD